jgi:hypothetical protein
MEKAKLNTTRLLCLILQVTVSAKLRFNFHHFLIQLNTPHRLMVDVDLSLLVVSKFSNISSIQSQFLQFEVALHASYAAFPILTSKFLPKTQLCNVIKIS